MRNAIIGLIIGIVAGIVLGSTVIAPRIQHHQTAGQSEGLGLVLKKAKNDKKSAEQVEAPTGEKIGVTRLRMASAYPETLPAYGTSAKRFESLVWRISDGALDIRFHEPGTLVPEQDAISAVASGTIDAHFVSISALGNETPAFNVFAGPVFGTSVEAYLGWMSAGGGQELFSETLADQGLKGTLCGMIPQAGGGWFREPLKTVQQFEGLRVRVPRALAGLYAELGALPDTRPLVDTVAALEQGTLDGAVLSAPHIDVAIGAVRDGYTYYLPDIRVPADVHIFAMSLDGWDALSPIQQSQIQTSCGDNIRHAIAESEAQQFEALKTITKAGADIQPWPAEVLDIKRAAWLKHAAAVAGDDETFERVFKSYTAFIDGQSIWEEMARP